MVLSTFHGEKALPDYQCSPFDPVLFGVELVEHTDLDVDGDAPDARELGAQPLVQQEFPEKSILVQ